MTKEENGIKDRLNEDLQKLQQKEEEQQYQAALDTSPLNKRLRGRSAAEEEARRLQLHQEQRKRVEIQNKMNKWEERRDKDMKMAMDKVEQGKLMREDRFNRILESVTGKGNLAYKTALALREREAHEDTRRRALHRSWDEKVYQPLVTQAENRMNPVNRSDIAKLRGSKSVDFSLPGEKEGFVLITQPCSDPAKKQLVDHARETAFHQAANAMLHGSQSAPVLLGLPGSPVARAPWPQPAIGVCQPRPGPAVSSVIPKATTKPTFEPTNWGQAQIQGTMFGQFAQACEYGPGFKRTCRGGENAHMPDTSDGVDLAGTRRSRVHGFNDVGILKGTLASQGEAKEFKTAHGASSGAPNQDHFTFETGSNVTSLEFPLGKKMFPQMY